MIEHVVSFNNELESRLWSAAFEAERYIGDMCGDTDEWPVFFGGRDDETATKLMALMQELHEAIVAYFPKKES